MNTNRKLRKTERKLFRSYVTRFIVTIILIYLAPHTTGNLFYGLLGAAIIVFITAANRLYWHLHVLGIISRKENA
jgi:hypothetical protein